MYSVNVSVATYQVNVSVAGAGGYISPEAVAIVPTDTAIIPAGKTLAWISVISAPSARTMSIGYSAGTTELLESEEIAANKTKKIDCGFYAETDTTIHFSEFTGSIKLYIF